METHMMAEIEEGMEGTGVKPGHVKIAIEEDFSKPEVTALVAGARVAKRCGFSLTVHQGMLLPPEGGQKITVNNPARILAYSLIFSLFSTWAEGREKFCDRHTVRFSYQRPFASP